MAHGIGTSEVERRVGHAMPGTEEIQVILVRRGAVSVKCRRRDIALAVIGTIRHCRQDEYAIEFGGSAIQSNSMEGAHDPLQHGHKVVPAWGFVAVDDTTIDYLGVVRSRQRGNLGDKAVAYWRPDIRCRRPLRPWSPCGEDIKPLVTWGASPEMVVAIDAFVPDPAKQSENGQAGKGMDTCPYGTWG